MIVSINKRQRSLHTQLIMTQLSGVEFSILSLSLLIRRLRETSTWNSNKDLYIYFSRGTSKYYKWAIFLVVFCHRSCTRSNGMIIYAQTCEFWKMQMFGFSRREPNSFFNKGGEVIKVIKRQFTCERFNLQGYIFYKNEK